MFNVNFYLNVNVNVTVVIVECSGILVGEGGLTKSVVVLVQKQHTVEQPRPASLWLA